MGLEKDGLAYFDYACEKNGFLRSYLQYLHPRRLAVALLACEPGMNKKKLCDLLNENSDNYREYTPSRLVSSLRDIRIQLYTIHNHAVLFGIANNIKTFSLAELEKIVMDHKKESEEVQDES